MRFLLFAGANNTLAATEVEAKISHPKEEYPSVYSFESQSPESAIEVVSKLGSSIKLAQELKNVLPEADSIESLITAKNFSVTDLHEPQKISFLNQKIKNILQRGRFILANDIIGLSPVIIKKHKIDEFFIDNINQVVWKTVWVHNFSHWIKKDRHMPYTNARAGVLPPKIARSMVNLLPYEPEGKFLIDPFCGSGRVLVEAAELGFKVAGADVSQSQCKETKINLDFLGFDCDVDVIDATHLSDKYKNVADAIVTEPYLGKPNPRPDQIRFIVPGLMKLYLGCLKDWLKVLKLGGYVVMVFPAFFDGKREYKTSEIIDGKLDQGYNIVKRGIMYSRPDADVKREIVILQKK